MWQKQTHRASFRESVKALEADIQHANDMVAALPRDLGGECIQMKLSYSPFAPFLLFLIEWMDCTCLDAILSFLGLLHIIVYKVYIDGMSTAASQEKKATLREFYAVIYPSLKQLESNLMELSEVNFKRSHDSDMICIKGEEDSKKHHREPERDDECGICMELDSRIVLPDCGHSMCISCYHDWYVRSESCPFCRGSLKRVSSGDLWVLTGNSDVVDTATLAKENLRRFYLYIDKLPHLVAESNSLMYDYMM